MTLAARIRSRGSLGFTLLEIVIALAIAALIVGGALGVMAHSSDECALRGASSEIEAMGILGKLERCMAKMNAGRKGLDLGD